MVRMADPGRKKSGNVHVALRSGFFLDGFWPPWVISPQKPIKNTT
jgi:hypothetical protein